MRRSMVQTGRGLLAVFALLMAIAPAIATAADEASELRVANPKLIVPESWENATVYLILQNKGKAPRELVGGRCEGCDWIEIRRAVFRDGKMESEKLEEMEVPAGGAVAFVPRGLSLSLVGLNEVEEGATVAFELEFRDGELLPVEAVAGLE